MRQISKLITVLVIGAVSACAPKNTEQTYRYEYETIANDPLEAKIYTLDNGLKIYLSVNKDEPRVVTQIAVRTGSKQDPADATGLAHYLEHMLFKGTSKFGTKDWEAESALLTRISNLYEDHRNTTDADERRRIYLQIDSLSGQAAKFAIANEYDKMIGSLGAKGTNAYTWYEQTVYINDIPANELEKWAKIESERFSELVLRLFHTELEAVYEEFNRTQDSDQRQAYYKMMEKLFPTHQYGTQTTIGTSEHLKNPSMEKIHAYFKERYQPNNMAIILSGDIDPDKTVDVIKKYFGDYKKGEIAPFKVARETPISAPIVEEVSGVEAEFVMVGYRLPGAGTPEAMKLEVMDGILSNGKAGLIDLNLVQKQKVIRGNSSTSVFTDYSVFSLSGSPRSGQDLDSVAAMLRGQIDYIKRGEFEDWMVEAVVNDLKLSALRQSETNWGRASKMVDAFVYGRNWKDVAGELDAMSKLTKQEIVDFANQWFGDNYVQVNKNAGESNAVKVEKPTITPVEIDRESQSAFFLAWDSLESDRLEPVFIDYKKDIAQSKFSDEIDFFHVPNKSNQLFSLYYILDMGSDHDQLMKLAVDYLPYLGTATMSPEELQKELFKLGVKFDVSSGRERSYVVLRGLNENLEEGVKLFEQVLANVTPDQQVLDDMVDGILKKRQDAMKSKGQIMFNAMSQYAQFGPKNPLTNQLSEAQLRAVKAEELTQKIKELTSYKHTIFYYGPDNSKEAIAKIKNHHRVSSPLKNYPEPVKYEELEMAENKVYFTNFDMVQSEMMLLSKGSEFNVDFMPQAGLFNEYFGSGLSSIVFQEIRESKALAYSAYSTFSSPAKKDKSHYIRAYIGAQVDKLPEAADAMLELMNNMPRADIQFEGARDAALKQIETNRTTRESVFWSYIAAKDRGLDYDIQKTNYEAIQKMTFDDLQSFFDNQIKGKAFTYTVIGNEQMVDMEVLNQLGPVQKLTLEELFGYPQADKPEPLVKK